MHRIDHAAIIDDLAASRGAHRTILDGLDPARTAHIVVDLQNGFMEPGAPVEVPTARGIVGNVNRISRALHDAGGVNIFLRYTTDPDMKNNWSVMLDRMGPAGEAHFNGFKPGQHYWELWPELDVLPGDLVIDKWRFGAFIPGTCDLHAILQQRGIDTLIITGTLSNCCCESTARDAMQLNYKVIFVADGNAAPSDEEHATTLRNMGWLFGDLYDTNELVEGLKQHDRAPQPA